MVFGGGLSLLQRDVPLMRGEDCTGQASSSMWTEQVVFGNTYVCKNTYMNAITVRETGGQGFEGQWEGFMGEFGAGEERNGETL